MTARLTPLRATLVAVAVLAGLFAMHGLTQHGEHLPDHGPAAQAAAHHEAGHATPPGTSRPDTDEVPLDGGAMAMCLAILLTGVLAWSGVRRPRRGLLLRLSPARVVVLPGLGTTRSPDPPTPWSLSVCRC